MGRIRLNMQVTALPTPYAAQGDAEQGLGGAPSGVPGPLCPPGAKRDNRRQMTSTVSKKPTEATLPKMRSQREARVKGATVKYSVKKCPLEKNHREGMSLEDGDRAQRGLAVVP